MVIARVSQNKAANPKGPLFGVQTNGRTLENGGWVGSAWHRGSILASHPAAPSSILPVAKNFSLDVAEI